VTNAMIEANELNPAIGGWSNYCRHGMASQRSGTHMVTAVDVGGQLVEQIPFRRSYHANCAWA
jgi:hypothetical protein